MFNKVDDSEASFSFPLESFALKPYFGLMQCATKLLCHKNKFETEGKTLIKSLQPL